MAPRLERDPAAIGPIVSGFTGTGFRVAGEVFARGLILTPDAAIAWDAPALEAMTASALAAAIAIDPAPEFLLLGTGATMHRPHPALVAALEARDIGIEAMDSRAAARAWGLLRGEGRWITAALLPLDA